MELSLVKEKKDVEVYKCNPNLMFSECKSIDELIEVYQSYVKKYGTTEGINFQKQKRLAELDMLEWRAKNGFKDLDS